MVNQDAFQWTMVGALTSLTVTSATGTPGLLPGTWQALGRADNSVDYDSPVVNGFSTRWMGALGEVAGDAGASRVLGVRLQNRSEGLTVERDGTLVALGGEYDFSKRTVQRVAPCRKGLR
jgi:predicted porin